MIHTSSTPIEVVTSKQYKIEYITCDKCNKEIRLNDDDPQHLYRSVKYYQVTTGHNDWGNDSFESRETFYLCKDCVGEFTKEYFADMKDDRSGYIEIESAWLTEDSTHNTISGCAVDG